MKPRRYGPLAYVPITRRPKLIWPGGARVALWVNPNIEFFGLDDVMPGNLNERVPREHARIPNVRNWAVRDYGNRVGIWRIMGILTRYGIRASAALNSEVCDHHPEIIDEAVRLGWELIGHNQTNALRLTEMDEAAERDAVRTTIDRIEAASGKRPVGWLGAGLAETWNTLDYLAEAGIRYVCDWVNDDQPYLFEIGNPPLVSLGVNARQREGAKKSWFAACASLLTSPATRRMPPKCGAFRLQPRGSPLRQTGCWRKQDSEPSVPRQESRRFEPASVPSRGGRCRRGGDGPGGDRRPDRAFEIADRRWCASEPLLERRIKPSRRVGPSRGTDGSNPSLSSGESGANRAAQTRLCALGYSESFGIDPHP